MRSFRRQKLLGKGAYLTENEGGPLTAVMIKEGSND